MTWRLTAWGTLRLLARIVCLLAVLPIQATNAADQQSLDFELASESAFVRLSELKPSITLLNFWHKDCAPCLREMPLLAQLAQARGVRVITIAMQKPADTLAAPDTVRQSLRAPLIALHAPREASGLLARFGNPKGALPHSVLLNSQRVTCASKTGELDSSWIAQAIAVCD
jgi:thiol-disulfide isomerase/thioredoxin